MVPKGWRKVELAELASFSSGGTPSKENKDYWDGDIPWLTAKDLKSFWLRDSLQKITKLGATSGTRVVPANTILMLVRGMTLLKDVPIGITTRDVAFNQDIRAIVCDGQVSPIFLGYYLSASKHKILQHVSIAGHGTGRLESDALKEFPILLPPKVEQHAIARILASWDEAIEKLSSLVKAKGRRKKGLMQRLLIGRSRIPGAAKGKWKEFRIGDLFDERIETNRSDLPLLSITRERGVIPRDGVERKDTSSEDKSKYLRICPGDIGYNTMRMWQGVSALSSLEGIVSPAYTICTPKAGVDGKFMAYLFKYEPIIHLFERYSQGLVSDTWNLKFHEFAQIKVRIPGYEEQKRIAAIFETADKEIANLQKQLDRLKAQKKGLMQQLLTGKLRVNPAAKAA